MEKAVSYQENVAGKIIIKIFTTDMFITTIIIYNQFIQESNFP